MPIDYQVLRKTLRDKVQLIPKLLREQADTLHKALQLFNEISQTPDTFSRTIRDITNADSGIRCALPTEEKLNAALDPPIGSEKPIYVCASDGSQIYPDRHHAFLYALTNIGFIEIMSDGQYRQEVRTDFMLWNIREPGSSPMDENSLNLLRDVRERCELAERVSTYGNMSIGMMDGPLELFREPRNRPELRHLFNEYIDALKETAKAGSTIAGYIDRPSASMVVRSMELSILPAKDFATARTAHPFAGIADIDLFGEILQPGQRSAVFQLLSSSSNDYEGEIALHFFYLNASNSNQPCIARVEIPHWVASSNQKIEILHKFLIDQSRILGGIPYPYILLRAHEAAVVTIDTQAEIERMIEQEMIKVSGKVALSSAKLAGKLA